MSEKERGRRGSSRPASDNHQAFSIIDQRLAKVSRYLVAFGLMAVDAGVRGNHSARRTALKITLGLPGTVAKLLRGRP